MQRRPIVPIDLGINHLTVVRTSGQTRSIAGASGRIAGGRGAWSSVDVIAGQRFWLGQDGEIAVLGFMTAIDFAMQSLLLTAD